jgi:hypothetical protein
LLRGAFSGMSEDYFEEALKDARVLARRISPDDYENLKKYWENKSYTFIAYMLRRYGIEFKGLTHLETLVNELKNIKEKRT